MPAQKHPTMLNASLSIRSRTRVAADPKAAAETLLATVRNAVSSAFGQSGMSGRETSKTGGVDVVLGKPELTCEISFGPDPRNDSADLLIRRNGARRFSVVGQMLEDGSRWCGYKIFVHQNTADAHGAEVDLSAQDSALAVEELLACLRALNFSK